MVDRRNREWHIVTLFALLVLTLNFFSWRVPLVEILAFIIFFVATGLLLARALRTVLPGTALWQIFYAYFSLFFTISFIIGAVVSLYKYTPIFSVVTLWLVGTAVWFFLFLRQRREVSVPAEVPVNDEGPTVGQHRYLLLLLPVLLAGGTALLLLGRTGEYILTPWESIPKVYVYVFLLISFIMALLVFSRARVRVILFFLILYSFLLHAYLPAVYQTGFGGDKWRHLASEKYLQTETVYSPALFGESLRWLDVGPVRLPEVLVAGNKTSYGNQWGITLLMAEFLHVDIFWIDYWLVFVIWSLAAPLLFYQLAGVVYSRRSFRLLVAFLPALFYTFQVFGAITIPVSLGNLFFYFVLWLWLIYWRDRHKGVRQLAVVFSLLMYFGYVLNFILVMELALVILALTSIRSLPWRRAVVIVLFLGALALLPALEALMGYGSLKTNAFTPTGIVSNTADAFGTLSGLVAFIPRPTHIDQGNWLYNQTRQTRSQASLFNLRQIPFFFTVLVWGLILLGIQKIRKLPDKKVGWFVLAALSVLLINYCFSWYFMNGNHILARRLDLTISFFLLILLGLGIYYVLEDIWLRVALSTKIYGFALALAAIAASTYTSGPVLEVVTTDEVTAARSVWEQIDKQSPYCVVANTWPLLGLEYASGRQIVAGGFPVYLEYAQPERVRIFEGLIRKPRREDWLAQAFAVTGARECWYMLERRWVSDQVWQDNIDLFGQPQQQFGKVVVWRLLHTDIN